MNNGKFHQLSHGRIFTYETSGGAQHVSYDERIAVEAGTKKRALGTLAQELRAVADEIEALARRARS